MSIFHFINFLFLYVESFIPNNNKCLNILAGFAVVVVVIIPFWHGTSAAVLHT